MIYFNFFTEIKHYFRVSSFLSLLHSDLNHLIGFPSSLDVFLVTSGRISWYVNIRKHGVSYSWIADERVGTCCHRGVLYLSSFRPPLCLLWQVWNVDGRILQTPTPPYGADAP
jgi:hypothetical protein